MDVIAWWLAVLSLLLGAFGTTSAVRPLDDFPLARGWPSTNGDDGSPVEVTDSSGVEDLAFCGRPAWSPEHAADVVGATYSGEAEDLRGRTLARYDGQDADGVVDRLRDAIEACPEEAFGGTTQVYELFPADSGDDSFFVTHRYRSDYGFDTGLEVIGVIRLDDLVLLSFEYGEGGGSEDSIRRSLREVVDQNSALMPELCEYARQPCSQREPSLVVPIGPDGIEDLTLGMSAADAAAAGLLGEPRHDGSGCDMVSRADPSGQYGLMADIRPGVGVVSLWSTGYSVTPEGIGFGSSADEIAAAYPDATGDESGWTTPVPGHPDRAYWFDLGGDHLVRGVTLLLPDERCQDTHWG